jgi:hypothetical protein
MAAAPQRRVHFSDSSSSSAQPSAIAQSRASPQQKITIHDGSNGPVVISDCVRVIEGLIRYHEFHPFKSVYHPLGEGSKHVSVCLGAGAYGMPKVEDGMMIGVLRIEGDLCLLAYDWKNKYPNWSKTLVEGVRYTLSEPFRGPFIQIYHPHKQTLVVIDSSNRNTRCFKSSCELYITKENFFAKQDGQEVTFGTLTHKGKELLPELTQKMPHSFELKVMGKAIAICTWTDWGKKEVVFVTPKEKPFSLNGEWLGVQYNDKNFYTYRHSEGQSILEIHPEDEFIDTSGNSPSRQVFTTPDIPNQLTILKAEKGIIVLSDTKGMIYFVNVAAKEINTVKVEPKEIMHVDAENRSIYTRSYSAPLIKHTVGKPDEIISADFSSTFKIIHRDRDILYVTGN